MLSYVIPFLAGLALSLALRLLAWVYVVYDSQPSMTNKLNFAIWPNLGLLVLSWVLPSILTPHSSAQEYLLDYGFPGALAGNMVAALIFAALPRMTSSIHKKIWGRYPR